MYTVNRISFNLYQTGDKLKYIYILAAVMCCKKRVNIGINLYF